MSRLNNQLPNLEKLFKDEDDQDFAPIAGSNLAAIFGTPQKVSNVSASFKQSVQKKSISGRNTPQNVQQANKTEVIIAKVILAYKLQNGQYTLLGKLGIALTANTAASLYQIILYRSKQDIVSVATLTPEFSYTIHENNYATYYDSNNVNWSLHFEDDASCIDFAREVGISRFQSRQTKVENSVFYQNLSVDDGKNGAKENDELHIKSIICTNLIQPIKFDGFSMQSMTVQISQYDNWERSLLDCSKGLKRLLILPSNKQISLGPGFPKEKEIIMEIEIIDVIKADDKISSLPKPLVHSGKASIISRMAKMGQSMLPKVPTSTTDSEDTEEEIHVKSPRRFKPDLSHSLNKPPRVSQESPQETNSMANVLMPRAMVPSSVPLSHRPIISSPALASPWAVSPIQQQYVTMDGQYYPMHQTPVNQSIPVAMDPNLNVFLSETRTQNTEIRMGMSKIADSVQKLLDKFHVLEVQNASTPMNLRRSVHHSMDEILLNEDKFSRREISKNSSTEIPFSDEHLSKGTERENKLQEELNETRGLVEEYSVKNSKLNTEKQEWSNEKLELEKKIALLEKTIEEGKIALEAAEDKITQLQEKNSHSESIISDAKAEKPGFHKPEQKPTMAIEQKSADIKRLMNNKYKILLTKFIDQESYATDFIKETLADTIRKITFTVLNDLQREEVENSDIVEERRDSLSGNIDGAIAPNELPKIRVGQEPPPIPPMDGDFMAPDAN